MAKRQNALRTRIEYAGVLFIYALFAWPPLFVSKAIAFAIADVWRFFDKRHRAMIIRNTMERLGIDRAAAEALAKKNYRHYLLLFLEVARLKRMTNDEASRCAVRNGVDTKIADALSQGKGLVLATGHLGNWEWGAVMLGMMKGVSGMIARPLDNPLIDEFVRKNRERTGANIWDKGGSMRKALAALREGKGMAALVDQDGGHNGCRVPFLGRMGTSMSAPIDLAIRTGAPILVGAMMRTGDMQFIMVTKDPHWPSPDADPEQERIRLLTLVNNDLSDIIRAYPEQWIWIHNRWKTIEREEREATMSKATA